MELVWVIFWNLGSNLGITTSTCRFLVLVCLFVFVVGLQLTLTELITSAEQTTSKLINYPDLKASQKLSFG